jgi:hypothetical protein
MQPDQIVMGKMKGYRRLQVFKLLAESVCEAGKAPHAQTTRFHRPVVER